MAPNIQLTLRTALIAAFIPAFALCIAAGVTTRHVLPAISLIPMSGSFLSSIIILSVNHWKIDDANHDPESRTFGPVSLSGPRSKASNPLILFLWDTFLAVCIIGLLVGSWLYFDHFSGPKLILATYATVPLLASL